jgi:hypothetical protein
MRSLASPRADHSLLDLEIQQVGAILGRTRYEL